MCIKKKVLKEKVVKKVHKKVHEEIVTKGNGTQSKCTKINRY